MKFKYVPISIITLKYKFSKKATSSITLPERYKRTLFYDLITIL